jgi:hypothetical protein
MMIHEPCEDARRWKSLSGREIKCDFWFRMLKFFRAIWIGIAVDKLQSESESWNRSRNADQRLNMFMSISEIECDGIGIKVSPIYEMKMWEGEHVRLRGSERRCVLLHSGCAFFSTKNTRPHYTYLIGLLVLGDTFWKVLLIQCYLKS